MKNSKEAGRDGSNLPKRQIWPCGLLREAAEMVKDRFSSRSLDDNGIGTFSRREIRDPTVDTLSLVVASGKAVSQLLPRNPHYKRFISDMAIRAFSTLKHYRNLVLVHLASSSLIRSSATSDLPCCGHVRQSKNWTLSLEIQAGVK